MAKKSDQRRIVGLRSEESGERLYYTTRSFKNKADGSTPLRLELRKYSKKLRKVVLFVETKKNLGRNEAPKR